MNNLSSNNIGFIGLELMGKLMPGYITFRVWLIDDLTSTLHIGGSLRRYFLSLSITLNNAAWSRSAPPDSISLS
jgi:hypothetical protein